MSEETKKKVEEAAQVEVTQNEATAPADQAETTEAVETPEAKEKEEVPVAEEAAEAEAPAQEAPEASAEEAVEETPEEAPEAQAEEAVAEEATEEPKAKEEAASEEVEAEEEATSYELMNASPEEVDWDELEATAPQAGTDVSEEEKMYEATLGSLAEHQVVDGKIIAMSDREVIIDIESKSEGVVSLNEFRYNPDLKVGDAVEVLIDKQEDKNGQLVLSHKKARQIRAWDRVNDAHAAEEIVNGYVKCRTKGGMIVDVFGIEAFLPGSQIDVKPIRDYDAYVNKTMEFRIVKINHEFKNVVVSHKALIEADLEEQKKEIISKLEKGQVLEGVVKNITSYGVFVDLGGVDGLVHVTDLSWSRVGHPSEMLELDQKINVVILDFDESKTRIQLGIKQLEAHPWDQLADKNFSVGDKIKGKVVVIADYGAFVEILPGVEGLIHVSEMSWSTHLRSAQDFVSTGQEVECIILSLDMEERKMSLGMKQLTPDPWTDITSKYPQGSKHKGTVRNFTNFGIFVELEEGIDGLIHISDLSWTKKIKHPSEFTSVGSLMEVVVLEIDTDNRKLSLGHKQVTDNPWDTYATLMEEGSILEGKVNEIVDRGATVTFENIGVEAFIPGRHMGKEDGSQLKAGEVADFKVIEFNKEGRRVVVSHSQIHGDVQKESNEKEAKETGKNVKKIQANVERSTLGDIEALSQLKADMQADEDKKKSKK
ncbi:MAG: 30S ribosomal protein S1 [Flavobacteriia bacterium]|nr:30S ribosomal protein S1 [Flavobacteriia bacterium]